MRKVAFALLCLASSASYAGLFDDDQARRAILESRKEARERHEALERELNEKLDRSSRTQLELASQIEALRQEVSRLRGSNELLTKELADLQQRQKDVYADLDARLKKAEPRQVSVDGQTSTVDAEEQRLYDLAIGKFNAGDYKTAADSLSGFLSQYSASAYAPTAQFLLGNAYYALRDYKNAIAAHEALVKTHPGNSRIPDSLLTIASSQFELNNKPGARKTLDLIVKSYPGTPAAKVAKDRLAVLK